MNWLKAIGYGFVLFAIMFVLGSIVMFGLKIGGSWMSAIMMIASVVVLWILAKQYGVASLKEGLTAGLVWLIVDAVMEYILVVQVFNQGNLSFYTPSLFLGYALIVLVPGLVGQLKK